MRTRVVVVVVVDDVDNSSVSVLFELLPLLKCFSSNLNLKTFALFDSFSPVTDNSSPNAFTAFLSPHRAVNGS